MEYLIGIDLGTSGTKTVLFDRAGTVVASATIEYPMYQEKNGWAEQEPLDWWNAAAGTIRTVIQKSGVDSRDIKALGISGQMHGLVMLDKDGAVLRRSIIWCDQRTAAECEEITEKVGKERLIQITANPALTGFTASKILWVRNHQPEIYQKCAHILLPKDYVRYMLTGDFATEVSDASGMQLLDVPHRCWSQEVLEKLDIDPALLPKVYESPEVTGVVSQEAAARTGLAAGTLVVGGAGDNAAAAVGTGTVGDGACNISLGTSGVAAAISPIPAYDMTASVTGFADCTGHWLPLACTINGSRISDAGRAALGVDYDELAELAAASEPGAGGITLVPYFDGERTPNRPDATAALYGMTLANTKRENIARAFVEGLLCSQRDCLELVKGLGVDVKRILLIGGGAKSAAVRALAPAILGMDVELPETDEYVAIGAARQAAWVLSGEAEPPAWPVKVETTLTGEPTPQVYEQYVRWRG